MAKKRHKHYIRKARRPLEWLFIWLGQQLIPVLTLGGVRRLARLFAAVALALDRRGRAVAGANLRVMFGRRLTPARERAIIRHAYRNMVRVLLDMFWLSRDTRARVLTLAQIPPDLLHTLQTGGPLIAVSAHLGNWEILSQACVAHGIPMVSVAKRIGSPGMTERLTRLRSTIGQRIVPSEGALRPLMHALKSGISIGLLVDQHVPVGQGGVWADFFGLPTGISSAPAAFSRKFGVPIVFAWSRPLRNGRYRIERAALFTPGDGTDDAARTRQLAAAFERVIRRHPSLWCLNYRRWKTIPPGGAPARYPFYARPQRPPKRAEGADGGR